MGTNDDFNDALLQELPAVSARVLQSAKWLDRNAPAEGLNDRSVDCLFPEIIRDNPRLQPSEMLTACELVLKLSELPVTARIRLSELLVYVVENYLEVFQEIMPRSGRELA